MKSHAQLSWTRTFWKHGAWLYFLRRLILIFAIHPQKRVILSIMLKGLFIPYSATFSIELLTYEHKQSPYPIWKSFTTIIENHSFGSLGAFSIYFSVFFLLSLLLATIQANYSVFYSISRTFILPFTKQVRLFKTCRKKTFENIVGKGENARNQHFLLFPHKVFYLINPFPNKPLFLTCLQDKSWKHCGKLLITSNFSFSQSVFYPLRKLSTIFRQFQNCPCKLFDLEESKFSSFWKD